jgi:NADH:ubiquinone oxidoreductase subunit 5 (subunit L)/multisubunit Na+/H+ antiporter MnhA subunit
MTAFLIAAVALPAVLGALLLLGGRNADRVAPVISVTAAAATLVAALGAAMVRAAPVDAPLVAGGPFELHVDGLSAVLLPMVAAVTVLVLVFSAAERTAPPARFHGLMLLFLASVVITVTATTLPALLFAWEIMGATSYALIGFPWREPAKVEGGFVAFVVTRSADLGLYLAAGAAVAGGVGWRLDAMSRATGPWLSVIAAGVLVSGLGKAAQLPFSFWLSRAMEGPSQVSALLHSAAMVAMGGYLLLRLQPLLAASGWAAPTAAWIGGATAVLLGVVALAQRDLKQVLAASTASQLGFVVLAAGVGSVSGGVFQLVAHAATKALLFLVAGVWLSALGTKQLASLRGAARRWPLVGSVFAVGALSLAGLPPFPLWLAKDTILAAALETQPALYVVGLVGAVLAAAYTSRILVILFANPHGGAEAGFDEEQPGTRRVPPLASIPLVVLAIAVTGLALAALPPLQPLLQGVLATPGAARPTALELFASAVLALIVLVLTAWRGGSAIRLGRNWFGLETAARVAVTRPVLALAALCARFEALLDAAVEAVATGTVRIADGLRRVDDRGIDAGVERIAAATAAAGSRIRGLQSGRIESYFTAAAAVGVAAVLLLIVVR